MAGLWETIRSLVARLFGGSDARRRASALETMEANFAASKRDNTGGLEALKEEIRTLESRAMQKKQEFERSHGDSRRVVAGEIERVFREMDRLRGRETIIGKNLDRIGVALDKIREAKAALQTGVTEGQFDEIALELQDLFATLRQSDKAARDLERERYEVAEPTPVKTEQRVAEFAEETKPPITLSPETEERLKKLEAEEA
ncbi:MAG: hypothetical protein JW955_04385 [Sedimentisphaerales bacterium]|nr:hypothetical protein [Sedimentisphaerales bacterium]